MLIFVQCYRLQGSYLKSKFGPHVIFSMWNIEIIFMTVSLYLPLLKIGWHLNESSVSHMSKSFCCFEHIYSYRSLANKCSDAFLTRSFYLFFTCDFSSSSSFFSLLNLHIKNISHAHETHSLYNLSVTHYILCSWLIFNPYIDLVASFNQSHCWFFLIEICITVFSSLIFTFFFIKYFLLRFAKS